ncbi:Coumaroyl-CoA:anthocyanidin 3-O-glucoside-6''-O-coumaroyltransferase 1 [Linum grandiflorum]
MSQYSSAVKTVAELNVSPPPASVPANSTPLTFFDLQLLHVPPTNRILFYDFPHSTSDFHSTVLPTLAASLSLALTYFYPFAGKIIVPPPPGKPHILYSDGCSIPLTVAEATTDLSFHQLSSNIIDDVALLEHLFPAPVKPSVGKGAAVVLSPLLALKITLFPFSGFSIAAAYNHATADGMAFNHFMKSWASISKSGNLETVTPPSHNRASIKDENKLDNAYLDQCWKLINSNSTRDNMFSSGKVRATFLIDGDTISRLKASLPFKASAFVVTSAFVWTSLIKYLEEEDDGEGIEIIDSYMFVADCRGRLDPPLPETYFGNCLSGVRASVKRGDLVGEDGFVIAAREITAKIKEERGEGVLRDAEDEEMAKRGKVVTVGGSPRMRSYETDFGFGRPRKSDLVRLGTDGMR